MPHNREEELKRIAYYEAGHFVIGNQFKSNSLICDQITLKYNPVNNEYNGQTQIKTNYNPDNFFDGNMIVMLFNIQKFEL